MKNKKDNKVKRKYTYIRILLEDMTDASSIKYSLGLRSFAEVFHYLIEQEVKREEKKNEM
jgi:hypothetical protein